MTGARPLGGPMRRVARRVGLPVLYHVQRLAAPLAPVPTLAVEPLDAGFPEADCAYNGLGVTDEGRICFALSSHRADVAARLFAFDPERDTLEPLPPLPAEAGGGPIVAHGKIHVRPTEFEGRIYFATHVGYYERAAGRDLPAAPPGFRPYPGGYFAALDPAAGRYRVLSHAPPEEGIIAMALDPARGRLYGLTWPGGLLLRHELVSGAGSCLGAVLGLAERGERGAGTWVPVCRSLGLDPRDGSVYWSLPTGEIGVYRPQRDRVERVGDRGLARLGAATRARHRLWGYAWRAIAWHPVRRVFYGVMGAGPAILFAFDPDQGAVRQVATLGVTRRWAGFERSLDARWVTLAFDLDWRRDVVTYLGMTRGPVGRDYHRLRGTVHHLRYDLATGVRRDDGRLACPDGRLVTKAESIACHRGVVYAVGWLDRVDGAEACAGPASRDDRVSFLRFPCPVP